MGSNTNGAVKKASKYLYSPAIEKLNTAASCSANTAQTTSPALSRRCHVRAQHNTIKTRPTQGVQKSARCLIVKSNQLIRI